MSTVSGACWQRVYHSTLYSFSREGREEILRSFRDSPDVKSASCIYDTENHQFELSFLSTDGDHAERVLAQLIDDFIQIEEDQCREFADYEPKAVRFPHAVIDEGDTSVDDGASESGGVFKNDDLIDLSTEAEKTSWLPSAFSTQSQLDSGFPQDLLHALGQVTHCQLTLDSSNRRIVIKPMSTLSDVSSVKLRLTNIEDLYISEIPVIHSLKISSQPDLIFRIQKLHENAEENAAFNEDGTLSRLLFPADSSVFNVRNKTQSRGKILQMLSILRAYKRKLSVELSEPVKVKQQPLKPPAEKPMTTFLSCMKFRELGSDAVRTVQQQPEPEAVERAPEHETVKHWVDDVVESQLPAPSTKPVLQVKATPPSTDTVTKKTPEPVSRVTEGPFRNASHSNVFATSTYDIQYAAAATSTNAPPEPAGLAWDATPIQGGASPRDRPSKRQEKSRCVPSPSKPKPKLVVKQSRGPPPTQNNSRNKQPWKPQPPKSLASTNPFAQLGMGEEEEEDDEEEPEENQSGTSDVKERLAQEDLPPARLRVNRRRAPGPPPLPRSQTDELDLPSSSEPSAVSTPATSLASTDDISPFSNMLKSIKREDMDLRLQATSFRNSVSRLHSSLERARALQGCLSTKVQLGKIVVRHADAEIRNDITAENFESKFKQVAGMDTLDRSFTNNVTTSATDIDALLQQLGISESSKLLHQSAFFELYCVRSDKSYTRIIVDVLEGDDEPAEPFAQSSEALQGVWYNHHPQRAWDSRLVISNHTNYPLENISGANEFVHRLSIRHDADYIAPSVGGLNNDSLSLDQARFCTVIQWPLVTGWNSKEDIYIEVKRVLDEPISVFQATDPSAERGRFSAICPPEKKAIRDQCLWYEISLGLVNPSTQLIQNEPYPQIIDPARPKRDRAEVDILEHTSGTLHLYEKANWKPEEVLTSRQLLALHEVATKVVERMDGIGAKNKGFGAQKEADLKKAREKQLNMPDQFW
ncbi:MAG: hypothetical protein Q9162_003520 [Coniocarpon cinnabarinum]